jgi:SNF2 family DNA or RNA helicase
MLYPHQITGVRWLVDRETGKAPYGGFLCDEMGLGKTIQLIETMRANPLERTLILVPKSIITQWAEELERRSVPVHVYDGPKRELVPAPVVLAPYSVATDLTGSVWDRIILDEGHEIRNPKSKLFKTLCSMKASVRWVVSGTPVFNSMKDFVTLCQFVGYSAGMVAREYELIRKEAVLRRTKAEVQVMTDTPMLFSNVELEMYPEEQQLYLEAYLAGQGYIQEYGTDANSMEILECLLRIRQVMVWPQLYLDGMAVKRSVDPVAYTGRSRKHEYLMESIESHPEEKSLVFTQFTGETDRIQELLAERGVPVFRLDGNVDTSERVERIAAFKRAGPNAVFLIQIRAGGVGLNLQEASRVYITAPAWNPATELQAIGRSHRTGQTRPVVVKKLLYKDASDELPSIEEAIVNLQMAKSRVCADVLGDRRLELQVPAVMSMKLRTIAKFFRST